jgi:hypothetical protein
MLLLICIQEEIVEEKAKKDEPTAVATCALFPEVVKKK